MLSTETELVEKSKPSKLLPTCIGEQPWNKKGSKGGGGGGIFLKLTKPFVYSQKKIKEDGCWGREEA